MKFDLSKLLATILPQLQWLMTDFAVFTLASSITKAMMD